MARMKYSRPLAASRNCAVQHAALNCGQGPCTATRLHDAAQQRPVGSRIQEKTADPEKQSMPRVPSAKAAKSSGVQTSTAQPFRAVQSGAAEGACHKVLMRQPEQAGGRMPSWLPAQPVQAGVGSRQPLQPLMQQQQHQQAAECDVPRNSHTTPGSSQPACAMPPADMTPPEVVDLTTDPTQPPPEPLQPQCAPAARQSSDLSGEVTRQDGLLSIQPGPQAPRVQAMPQPQQRRLAEPATSISHPAAVQLAPQAWEQPCLSQLAGGAGSGHAQVPLW